MVAAEGKMFLMAMRKALAVAAGKAVMWASRRAGLGAGSNLPGKVAMSILPDLPRRLASSIPGGCVLVSGTNGKTTTANLLAHLLSLEGRRPVHNRVGANLLTGITAAMVEDFDLAGRPRGDLGLFEVDEATLPRAVEMLSPRLVIVTNLYRDQLDRYGELETLASRMRRALAGLDRDSFLLLNADDPLVSTLGEESPARLLYFGLEDRALEGGGLRHAADSKYCRRCGSRLEFRQVYFSHMGDYRCPACGAGRPSPQISALRVELRGASGSRVLLSLMGEELEVLSPLPGLYNVHNLLAAAGAARLLGVDPGRIPSGIEGYRTVFGRGETFSIGGKRLFLVLSKNPTGFNEVIRTVREEGDSLLLLLALNDRIADGRDVSWIWDVDFEDLVPAARLVVATGTRAEDMALRMKYAGLEPGSILVEGDLKRALLRAVELAGQGETVYALTTYTATLEARRILSRLGVADEIWRSGKERRG